MINPCLEGFHQSTNLNRFFRCKNTVNSNLPCLTSQLEFMHGQIEKTMIAYNKKSHSAQHFLLTLALLSLCFNLPAAEKGDMENTDALIASCQAFNLDQSEAAAMPCMFYILGLIDGALDNNKLIDIESTAPQDNTSKEADQSLSWSERAYRYRVGARAQRGQAAGHTYYCTLDKELHAAVIEVLKNQPLQRVNSVEGVQIWVFEALKSVCPEFIDNP
jgi:hypothetical protein